MLTVLAFCAAADRAVVEFRVVLDCFGNLLCGGMLLGVPPKTNMDIPDIWISKTYGLEKVTPAKYGPFLYVKLLGCRTSRPVVLHLAGRASWKRERS